MFAGIFVNEKVLEGYCVKVHKIDPYIYEHYKQKIQVDNRIPFSCKNWWKKHADSYLIFEEKRKEALVKNLVVNLLELILAKKIMIQIMKLVEYKHSLVSLKTENLKN